MSGDDSISDQGMTEKKPSVGGGVTDVETADTGEMNGMTDGMTDGMTNGMTDGDTSRVEIDNDESGQSQDIVIENSVYQQNITEDMMKEIKQELLEHYPVHQDDVTNSNSNSS